jgi:hypothetical protein
MADLASLYQPAAGFVGRPQSTNIEDLRSPFGSAAVDPSYSADDRNYDFILDALRNPVPMQDQRPALAPVHLDELIMNLASDLLGGERPALYGRR